MKVFVTGGAGFIGSNFIRHLIQSRAGLHIVNYDALTYAGNLENLVELEGCPDYLFVRGDITDVDGVSQAMDADTDAVVNFAAESHVDRSILDSAAFIKTNIVGTQVLLETARRKKVKRFVQISTDEVYGSLGESGRFTETSPLAPNSPYAASKAGADLLVHAFHRTYGMDTVITRCCNNFGPYQFPEKLIPLMILNAIDDRPLPVYGDGLYTRDWIHATDHSRALERVLFEGRAGEVYNIGSSQEKSNLEVIHQLLSLLGKGRDLIEYVNDRPGHDRRYAIDATKLVSELGWGPTIPFELGLSETVQWYKTNPDWVERVKTGAYRDYYRRMYEQRDQTLADLR